jgi:hypothetical protein
MADQKEKVVIVVSTFYPKSEDGKTDFREIPELDKLLTEGWDIVSVTPVVSQQGSHSSNVGSMQLVVRLQK